MEHIIQTIALTKLLNSKRVVDGVDLAIPRGTIYGIVGANGAGKSTLLRLMHGLFWPSSGEIRLFGQTMPAESAEIRQRVQYVAADGEIYKSFQVRDLVKYSSWLYERWDAKRCQDLLAALELPSHLPIRQLSMGMKMQLRLAVALSAHPDLLLLDEPTTGLDAVVKRQFIQLILEEAARDGTTVVMATHQLADLERFADGVAVMYQGRVVADGMIDNLKTQFHRYAAVLPNGLPNELTRSGAIIRTEQHGTLWTIVAEDPFGRIEQALHEVGAHVEHIPLDLEDLFTYLLFREGYSREAILLA